MSYGNFKLTRELLIELVDFYILYISQKNRLFNDSGRIMASIIIVNGPNQGDFYPLGVRTNVVGRSEALPIQVLDPKASRKHLQIRYEKDSGSYLAVDMDSKHGTLVNGIEIKEQSLQDNDYITIGDTNLMFTLKDFDNRESALSHYKKVGERIKPTITNLD